MLATFQGSEFRAQLWRTLARGKSVIAADHVERGIGRGYVGWSSAKRGVAWAGSRGEGGKEWVVEWVTEWW
jgi:hypothetical protein